MLTQQTLERLNEMRLKGMAEAFASQIEQPDIRELSFEERLGLLVDQEWIYRQDRRLTRLLRQAKLRIPACIEDIDYHHPRGIGPSTVTESRPVPLDPLPSVHPHHRSDWLREDIYRVCSCQRCLSTRFQGPLLSPGPLHGGPGHGEGRRYASKATAETSENGRAHS